ncbi:MAG: DUF5691 domain-containing protein [Chloroflexota bacterium]
MARLNCMGAALMLKWDELVPTALLGTGQRQLLIRPTDDALAGLIKTLPKKDQAGYLLSVSGSLMLHEMVGISKPMPQFNLTDGVAPEPEWPFASDKVVQLLQKLIEDRDIVILTELLNRLAEHQLRVPERLLPYLLGLGEKNNYTRPIIVKALDNRGRWLARHNDAWQYAILPELDEEELAVLWKKETETLVKKRFFLNWYRGVDPAGARALLSRTWRSLPESSRQNLLDCLRTNLSLEDEPFLERTLDDRQLSVRRKAQELLARLPGSAYSLRLQGYAETMLIWHPTRETTLGYNMPKTYTHQLGRDGLILRNERKRLDTVTKRLSRLFSSIPLDYWETQIASSRGEFLDMVARSGRERTILTALGMAANYQNRVDWLLDLIPYSRFQKAILKHVGLLSEAQLVEMYGIMEQQPFFHEPLSRTNPLYDLLSGWKKRWPAEIAPKMAGLIAAELEPMVGEKNPDGSLLSFISRFIGLVPPDFSEDLKQISAPHENMHVMARNAIANGYRYLEKRRLIREAFGEND